MHKRYSKILDKLVCDEKSLQSAIQQISNLNPRPGEGFRDKFQVVIPDIIITEDGDEWLITTNDGGVPELRISKVYEEQLKIGKFEKDAQKFIKDVKKGCPFHESSPMLNDISAVPSWDKVT